MAFAASELFSLGNAENESEIRQPQQIFFTYRSIAPASGDERLIETTHAGFELMTLVALIKWIPAHRKITNFAIRLPALCYHLFTGLLAVARRFKVNPIENERQAARERARQIRWLEAASRLFESK
jgi:hypothetical protein